MTQSALPTFPLTIHAHWRDTAANKGFDILKRIRDRYHLLLACRACGATHISKLFVLMNNQPLCPHCIEERWRDDAAAAGLQWAGRDPEHRHYGLYTAACGHQLRRQFELIKRAAEGVCDVRCELCHTRTEQAEAKAQGWTLIGADPEGDPNYRKYRHTSCGHVQRIARVNMQTGRFGCGNCGDDWLAAPSHLYAMRFKLPTGAKLVKLGFSRNPVSRLRHQLMKDHSMDAQILKTVRMASGQLALQTEKRLHARLKATFPDSIAPRDLYAEHLNVRSEIYFPNVTREILQMLDEIETDSAA